MIICSLRDISCTPEEFRKGRYHGSNFWYLKGFAKSCWVVAAYIDYDSTDQLCQAPPWKTEEDIMNECVEYLNRPPKRKKYEKKEQNSPYGNLSIYQYTFKKGETGKSYIEALLVTDQRENVHFWGKGKSDKL